MQHVRERSPLRTFVPLLALALVPGCAGSPSAEPVPEPAPVVEPEAPSFADLSGPFATAVERHATGATDGWELFADACSQCHSMLPPAKAAPPMAVVMRHYRRAYGTPEETRAAMIFWVRNADLEWSVMPAHVVREHGLMPAQPLSVEQVERIVDYLLALGPADIR